MISLTVRLAALSVLQRRPQNFSIKSEHVRDKLLLADIDYRVTNGDGHRLSFIDYRLYIMDRAAIEPESTLFESILTRDSSWFPVQRSTNNARRPSMIDLRWSIDR